MKKSYEMIWEIFNSCSGNQMRDVFVEEIEIEDVAAYVANKFDGNDISVETTTSPGCTIYDIVINGLRQRLTFTEV
ncbi:hypothetical protein IZU99_09420 [Oscillospiraceae bacterium CM]|nr:hypothetical protein IZU99_09420 [Oscillospiraceae bacterium CM]